MINDTKEKEKKLPSSNIQNLLFKMKKKLQGIVYYDYKDYTLIS